MIFQELYGNDNRRPPMTENAMKAARLRRWDADTEGPQNIFAQDLSDQYNTPLNVDEEARYQAWAKENHREKDVYDYDLRGAWKELQSGTMTEDERGHLGDKYKKPNHMTFSDQSIYSGQGGVMGGTWGTDKDGGTTYTPGRKLSSVEADNLRRYFIYREPDVKLNLEGKLHQERPLPGITQPLGVFSGLGDTWKGIPAAALQTASSAITALKNTGTDILSRMGTEETRAWWQGQKAVMDQNARDIREYNKVHFEVDPETMGTASQIVHGLFKTLPKALGYGLVGGVAGGALAFGADVGIDETNRLMDEGVDRDTAINAGLVSFGMNAIGMRLPAVLGASRSMSAAYGAVANAGTNVAEVEGIKFILEHENYDKIAQQYDIGLTDLLISGALGGTFGAAFWRSPEQIRTQKYQDVARLVYEDQRTALFNKGKSQFNFVQAGTQAAINSRAVVSLAKILGIDPDKVRDFAAKIVWTEDGKSAEVPKEAFNMPVTQGKEWHMGPTKASPDEPISVVRFNGQTADRESALNQLESTIANGLKNEETGFTLSASRSDLRKTFGGKFSYDERLIRAIAPIFGEVVSKAKLLESSVDVQHRNPHIQGIHIFATPVEVENKLYRVQIIVRDYNTPKQERLAAHKIAGVQIYEIENPLENLSDSGPSDIRAVPAPIIRLSAGPGSRSDRTVTLSQLAGGRKPYVRTDGKKLFDPVDELQRTDPVNGVYYEAPNLKQTANRSPASTEGVPHDEQVVQTAKENGEIRGSFNPRTNTIKLTPNANLSTFSHEHSHWYLTNLFAHATDENLSTEARTDIDALLKAFGLKSVEEYNALPFDQKVKLQERYAAWTDRYLAEGKVPAGYLQGMFRRFAQWLIDMYRDILGEGAGNDAAKKEIGERYKAQFGEELPELPPEVRKVLDRMYAVQKELDAFKPNRLQTLAARIVQAQRLNNQKKAAPIDKSAISAYYRATGTAQQSAATALNTGEQVDVSGALGDAPVNDAMVSAAQNAFARSFQMGDTESIVVLQNRDRTSVASVGQMNAIAANPRYELLSFSRSTGEGAPIVSYGTMPEDRYLGRSDVVDDNGKKIPVTYAVVEAGSVQYSNSFDGTPNPRYGSTPDEMQVVAGNGRMAGLSEAYHRGTAEAYRTALEEDASLTGIKPEVAKEMQNPVLVRIMSPDFVRTGFIERSNSSNVMAKSALETAVQDSPKVRRNMTNYEFNEDGAPTRGTLQQFLNDIGEPSQLNNLLSADGTPNETAQNRIRAAIFYEAYRDRTLTALVADASDKQGIKRILNAMAAFAPHVIKIRQLSNGVLDFGPLLSEVANRIRQAKQNGEPLSSLLDQQGLLAGDNNPAVHLMMEFFIQNQNSTAGLMRVLDPFARGVETTLDTMGEGSLLGGADLSNFTLDMAEAMGVFRQMQNRAIDEANAVEGAKPIPRLPDIDVAGMRSELGTIEADRAAQAASIPALEPMPDTVPMFDAPPPEIPAPEDAQAAHIAHEQGVFSEEDSGRVMVESLAEIDPEMTYLLEDDDGTVRRVTAQELLDSDQAVDAQADTDMAGIGTAVPCSASSEIEGLRNETGMLGPYWRNAGPRSQQHGRQQHHRVPQGAHDALGQKLRIPGQVGFHVAPRTHRRSRREHRQGNLGRCQSKEGGPLQAGHRPESNRAGTGPPFAGGQHPRLLRCGADSSRGGTKRQGHPERIPEQHARYVERDQVQVARFRRGRRRRERIRA